MRVTVKSPTNGRPVTAGIPSASPEAVADTVVTTAVPPVSFDHEDLVMRRGRRSGRYVVVAIHSTALGPALGGVRLWHYEATIDGARDALRLARGMTHKAAAAGLDLGGGKGVICAPKGAPPAGRDRRALLLDFGDLVESLGGRYITAEDVGIDAEDLVVISERTRQVTGLPPDHGGSGDPSPFTALGVEAAMRACARERFGSPDLSSRRIVIAGLGHVGSKLARRLADAGAELAVSDIDSAKRSLATELEAEWIEPSTEMLAECDILAPCALGGAIDAANLPRLRCEIVCGCANNQLADEGLADALAERGILYAPDFIVNAGGLIHIYREIRGYSEREARQFALGIEGNVNRVLTAADERAITPLRAARELAQERLDTARQEPVAAA
ncbi:MAG: Glu/Leu/Phe/Val dehydrogenase dimerization domain-containing protein [Actinomycetota bacterium]